MYITITIAGATPEEIARGLTAAQAVFDRAGVTPLRAAEARFNLEGWDIAGFDGAISQDDLDLAGLWDEADQAALGACCAGWDEARKPETAQLELVDPRGHAA